MNLAQIQFGSNHLPTHCVHFGFVVAYFVPTSVFIMAHPLKTILKYLKPVKASIAISYLYSKSTKHSESSLVFF